jgi:hypothetical protein
MTVPAAAPVSVPCFRVGKVPSLTVGPEGDFGTADAVPSSTVGADGDFGAADVVPSSTVVAGDFAAVDVVPSLAAGADAVSPGRIFGN